MATSTMSNSDGAIGTESKPAEERDRVLEEKAEPEKDAKKKPNVFSRAWTSLGLDVPTLLMMGKAGIPPVIAMSMYQSDNVAKTYSTLGYLVSIISILGMCIMPRAKFLQTMIINVFVVCFASGMAMLMTWSGVQARLHTQTTPAAYNSSQSAVCAVWLFFQIWLVNSIKSKFPQFSLPTIMYAIFVNVAGTYGPEFPTVASAESFVKRLLISFLTALAIASGVSLFILPISCRKIVFKEMAGEIGLLRAFLQTHKAYLQSLETGDMFSNTIPDPDGKSKKPKVKPQVEALKKMSAAVTGLHGKLHGDLPFAKRETAYGKLNADELEEIFKRLRNVMAPLLGLTTLVDIFGRFGEMNHWEAHVDGAEYSDTESEAKHKKTVEEWNDIMQIMHDPFADVIQAMDQGLQHVLLKLELATPPKKKKKGSADAEAEAKGDLVEPGDKEFATYFTKKTTEFSRGRQDLLSLWCDKRGVKLPADESEKLRFADDINNEHLQHYQRQLYLVLYIAFLLHSVGLAVLDLVTWADEHDQTIAKKKLILPGKRRLKKWFLETFKEQDTNHDDAAAVGNGIDGNNTVVYMGEAFKARKDPEHLPPTNAWEKFGAFIRGFGNFLRSPHSAFGFRAACATMSVAIVAYLHDTQVFFTKQRLVWAMIMVAISMTPTAGQSMFQFVLRVLGTVVAMVISFLVWYIPDAKTPGVLVFLWLAVAIGFYIPLKKPELIIVGLISVVSATMIIGYELEVRKIGEAAATSNGQPYYKIYLLGPYRLATVAGGLAVAAFWTFFPYPISEHSALRQSLGGALYLSSNYYSVVHETIMARLRGDEGDVNDKSSPGYALAKARNKVFAKQLMLQQVHNMHSSFVKWGFPLGGKFPKREYDTLIECTTHIFNYTNLLAYASQTFTDPRFNSEDAGNESESQWFNDLRKIVVTANITSHEITSLLALLSSSVTNGVPLPPYLTAPESYQLTRRLMDIDRDILSFRHVAEPGYAAFAVIQISTRCIIGDLEKLLATVKKLVGELDFSFHVVSTQNSSDANSSSDTLFRPPSNGRSKQD